MIRHLIWMFCSRMFLSKNHVILEFISNIQEKCVKYEYTHRFTRISSSALILFTTPKIWRNSIVKPNRILNYWTNFVLTNEIKLTKLLIAPLNHNIIHVTKENTPLSASISIGIDELCMQIISGHLIEQ